MIVPNLHWRYTGVTATNRMVAPRLAKLFRAAWLGSDAPAGIARMGVGDLLELWRRPAPLHLARAPQQRDDRRPVAANVRLAAEAGVYVAAQRHHTLADALADPPDGCDHRDLVDVSASYLKRESTVVMHGVDTDIYAPPPDRAAAFAASGLPGRYAIGCFGRIRAQKGSDVFVEAMCRLLPRYPDFTAVMVGAITPEQVSLQTT